MRIGDRAMAIGFGLFGVVWIVQSRKLSYWAEYAPGSGFLPFWLGVIIVVMASVVLIESFRKQSAGPDPAMQEAPARRYGRITAIIVGLFACLAALDYVGFVVAVGAYLAFLLGVVERRAWMETVLVSAGASVGIWIVFKVWLKVPLPQGPWGF